MTNLSHQPIVLLDGAIGTELQRRGLALGSMPDLLNLSEPDKVLAVAQSYRKAGSRILLTNTFRSNRVDLPDHNVIELNREAAQLACEAAGGVCRVFGSIGPVAAAASDDQILAALSEQARALADAGVDGLVVETQTTLKQARIAVRAAAATGLPVVACMVFGLAGAWDHTLDGATIEMFCQELADAGAAILGSNCGSGPEGMLAVCERMLAVCKRMRAATKLPLWMKPNAGLPSIVGGRPVYSRSPTEWAAQAAKLAAAGATYIGGCCGAGPRHIAALAENG